MKIDFLKNIKYGDWVLIPMKNSKYLEQSFPCISMSQIPEDIENRLLLLTINKELK